jgi:hypothetical protein
MRLTDESCNKRLFLWSLLVFEQFFREFSQGISNRNFQKETAKECPSAPPSCTCVHLVAKGRDKHVNEEIKRRDTQKYLPPRLVVLSRLS